jgi:uncharacterized heparinase superfamily protein
VLNRTLRTVRHLRPAQLVARTSFVLERRLLEARPCLAERRCDRRVAAAAATTCDADSLWRWPPAPLDPAARARPERAAAVLDGRFSFLNEERHLPDPLDWAVPDASRLWRFQLHSFAYAVDLAVAARRHRPDAYPRLRVLVQSWLAEHPVSGADAWHPFVVASRLIAWLIARDLVASSLKEDAPFAGELRRALLTHAVYLAEHVESDIGGNHLLKNAVALLLAGCSFDGPVPRAWRERASRLLEAELPKQILADGGHYERSPMYHQLVLADLLVVLFAAGKRDLAVAEPLAEAVRRMQRFTRTLVHPDGEIPLFNDAALGEAPCPGQLIGPSTEPMGNVLAASGYFVLPVAEGSVLLADCGPPGPDDLPAHVHADALSFELSVAGRRVLVDGGVDEYAPGPRRDLLRGTAAHNTVEVDGQNQTEIWSSFRVGRRARVRREWWEERADGATLVGSHDGYARLGVRHERRLDAVPGVGWRVRDTLVGKGRHVAVARFRLHPTLSWRHDDADQVAIDGDGRVMLRLRPFGQVTVWRETGLYAERFGEVQEVEVVSLVRAADLPAVFGAWLLLPDAEPTVV